MAMASLESQYFHSTTYRFNAEARQAVITDFCAIINDASARCYYDADQHVFCLACPQPIGAHADDALGHAISAYVERELTAAEREEREPRVLRFPESIVDIEAHDDPTASPGPTSLPEILAVPERAPPFIYHVVASERNPSIQVMFFKLRELPEGMLERTLSPDHTRFKRMILTRMSCRIVRWDASKERYVFNGRIGTPRATAVHTTDDNILCSTTFVSINGDQLSEDDTERADAVRIRHFSFIGGVPSVQQFVEGVGNIEPDPPDFMPIPPRDAARFMRGPIQQPSGVGRIRVPKIDPTTLDSSNDEESDDEDTPTARKLNFKQLLMADASDGQDDVDGQSNGSSGQSEDRSTIKRSFRSLLHGSEGGEETKALAPRPILPTNTATSPQQTRQIVASDHESHNLVPSNSGGSPESDDSASRTLRNEHFPESSIYAKVDNYGLTSNAANHAQWELQNTKPRGSKSRRSGVTSRTPQTEIPSRVSTRQSSIGYDNALQELGHARPSTPDSSILLGQASTAVHSHQSTPCDIPTWANKINRHVSTRRLVDTSVAPTPSPVVIPPGYDYQDRVQAEQDQVSRSQTKRNQALLLGDHSPPLIEFDEDETSENTRPRVKLPSMKTLNPSKPRNGDSANPQLDSDDFINERLQPSVQEENLRRNTMRQRAPKNIASASSSKQKKKKKKAGGQPTLVVNLPKPDPIPLSNKSSSNPQHRQADSKSGGQPSKSQGKVSTVSTLALRTNSSSTQDSNDRTEPPPETAVGIQRMIQEISSSNDIAGVELQVQFGVILVKHLSDKDYFSGTRDLKRAEEKLNGLGANGQTEFFPRMTSSDDDAGLLLDLIGSEHVQTKVEYEIHIKTCEGDSRLVKFEQTDVDNFLVWRKETVLGTLFMHYPMRVWDARAIFNKPEVDLVIADHVRPFVESITTARQAPAFYATVPAHLFTVEKVYAKRNFSKISNGVEVRLTEIQDLWLQAVDSNYFNFKASITSRDTMIDRQRLWWEYSLRVGSVESVSPIQLHSMIDSLIGSIDDIGYENKGPWIRDEVDEPGQSIPEVPFW